MKIEKKIRNAYKKLPVPEAERVLPAAGREAEEKKPMRAGAGRLLRPALAAVVLVCVLAAGVIGALSLNRSTETDFIESGINEAVSPDSHKENGEEHAKSTE